MRLATLVPICALAACNVGEPGDDLKAGQGLSGDDKSSNDNGDTTIIESRVCAGGATTLGIDVSYYDGTPDWAAVKAAGYKFAFVRVSDGTGFHDPKFAQNWANTKAAGVVRGAYQFFRPNQSASAQADLLISAIGSYQQGDLPPVIDVEATGGLGPSGVASAVRAWVDRVKNALGVDPIVYTGKYFWRDQVGAPSSFANNPLWIAQYTSLCPDLPGPWVKWTFWQNSETGHVSGISGAVDLDKFNGSYDDLLAFANGTVVEPPPPGTCPSATMGTDEPSGTCVQAASDQKWYQCVDGSWQSISSTAGCTNAFAWCQSATLGRAVAPRTCVQAASDNQWYQCDGHSWAQPVDPAAATGPAGACSASYPR